MDLEAGSCPAQGCLLVCTGVGVYGCAGVSLARWIFHCRLLGKLPCNKLETRAKLDAHSRTHGHVQYVCILIGTCWLHLHGASVCIANEWPVWPGWLQESLAPHWLVRVHYVLTVIGLYKRTHTRLVNCSWLLLPYATLAPYCRMTSHGSVQQTLAPPCLA